MRANMTKEFNNIGSLNYMPETDNQDKEVRLTHDRYLASLKTCFTRAAKNFDLDVDNFNINQLCGQMMRYCQENYAGFSRTDSYLVGPQGVDLVAEVNGKKADIRIITLPVFFIEAPDEVSVIVARYDNGELSTTEVNCPKSFIDTDDITPLTESVVSLTVLMLQELGCIGASEWSHNRVAEFVLSGLLYAGVSEPHIVDRSVTYGEEVVELPGNQIFSELDSNELIKISIS